MTKHEVTIVIAEDDEGHADLITRNLKRAGIANNMLTLKDGQETLDFFFRKGQGPHRETGKPYLLLLDIRMPKMDGIGVLRRMKEDPELRKVPVIMVTTTTDPREVTLCHELGCSSYIPKPVNYEKFMEAIRQLGLFLSVVVVPEIDGEGSS